MGDIGAGATTAGATIGGPVPPSHPSTNPTGGYQRNKAASKEETRKLCKIPCYVAPQRGDAHYICDVDLFHDDPDPLSWTLRGVALLCNSE